MPKGGRLTVSGRGLPHTAGPPYDISAITVLSSWTNGCLRPNAHLMAWLLHGHYKRINDADIAKFNVSTLFFPPSILIPRNNQWFPFQISFQGIILLVMCLKFLFTVAILTWWLTITAFIPFISCMMFPKWQWWW